MCTFSIWVSYGIQQEDVAVVRTNLLLRCLIVDSDPFQDILLSCFNYLTSPSQQRFVLLRSGSVILSELYPRLSSVNRLFRMISDVTSPAFNVEGRQWRSSVIEIFYYYFTALWADPMVGRLSVSNTIPHNLDKLLGRGSIISAIFVGRFTASPSRSYIAVLG